MNLHFYLIEGIVITSRVKGSDRGVNSLTLILTAEASHDYPTRGPGSSTKVPTLTTSDYHYPRPNTPMSGGTH